MPQNQTNARPRWLPVAGVMCPLIRDAAAASVCLWLRQVEGGHQSVCVLQLTGPRPWTSCPHCALVKGNHISYCTGFSRGFKSVDETELDGESVCLVASTLTEKLLRKQKNTHTHKRTSKRFISVPLLHTSGLFPETPVQRILAPSRLCEECLRVALTPVAMVSKPTIQFTLFILQSIAKVQHR